MHDITRGDTAQSRYYQHRSDYGEKHSIARLIGAPPGYVGYEEGGQLTETVRRRPYCVLLFDEIEKAHPDVFNLFLQVFDDGRLTDGQGRTVNFSNSVIIMTSNIGGALVKQMGAGFSRDERREAILRELDHHFRPEFLNRLDDIIVFHSLNREHIVSIVDLLLARLERILADRRMTIELSDAAKALLADNGWDPVYGARPLKRAIQRELQDPLAMAILEGTIQEGDQVYADIAGDGEGLQFQARRVAPAVG